MKGFVAAIKMLKLPFYINGGFNMTRCVKMMLSKPSITNTWDAVFRK